MAEPIAALSTASGPAAIAVVRLSGHGIFALAKAFLAGLPEVLPPRTLIRALVVGAGGSPLDEVLVAAFPAPASYTGEDVLEIQCHGGLAIARAVEERVLDAGLRRARPGEFTARAVENGKMDLLDAEALAALLLAEDDRGLLAAQGLRGAGEKVRGLRKQAREALAEARGLTDYPIETGREIVRWRQSALRLREEIEALVDRGSIAVDVQLREGLTVAILGPPNSGKSSLVNALTGEARSLVDADPGTTRDAVHAPLFVRGQRVTLVDTAGLREASGVEKRGVARGLEVAAQSEARIWLEDISAPPILPPPSLDIDLRVLSKVDLASYPGRPDQGEFRVSAHTKVGLAELQAWIGALTQRPAGMLSARQRRELGRAVSALRGVEALADDLAIDRLAIAEEMLARLTGEAVSAIDVAEVYAQFCIGK